MNINNQKRQTILKNRQRRIAQKPQNPPTAMKKLLADHPFSVAAAGASLFLFLSGCFGFYFDYILLKSFGINLVLFSDFNDYLLSILKNPTLAGFTVGFIVLGLFYFNYEAINRVSSGIVRAWIVKRKTRYESLLLKYLLGDGVKHYSAFNRISAILYKYFGVLFVIFAFYFAVGSDRSLDKRVQKIKGASGSLVILTTKLTLSNAAMISATDKFTFFWLKDKKQAVVIPKENIASIFFMPPKDQQSEEQTANNKSVRTEAVFPPP
ncbi:MAG: hypothetical protein MJK04_11965 [Psychrosphaera sp.]|nr:hypothetical protein [Psychrosphaera sp.]